MKRLATVFLAGIIVAASAGDGQAQRGRDGGGGGMGMHRQAKAPYEYFEKKGLFPTGLKPAFPDGVQCPGVSSLFGSSSRYDGSRRNNSHHGYHNGMDISLDTGTPLLAVADSTVVHKGTGGMLVGNFIWLHFAPEATGLPVHLFARYQHLDEPSPLSVGDKVSAGQEIAVSGYTGTTGGYFGAGGYPHLHINYLIGKTADHTPKKAKLGPEKALDYLDPLGLYVARPVDALDNHRLRALPAGAKSVAVPVKTTDGRILPAGSKVVWPVACQSR